MTTLDALVQEIAEWQAATFGAQRDASGPIAHLGREALELDKANRWVLALEQQMGDQHDGSPSASMLVKARADAEEELADVFMLWVACAAQMGCMNDPDNLLRIILAKLEKNRQRKWGKPDAHGVIEHVKGRG